MLDFCGFVAVRCGRVGIASFARMGVIVNVMIGMEWKRRDGQICFGED